MKFKSQLVTQVSGSVGGLVGSHNRGGLYFRARSIPVNPGTSFQTDVRNAFQTLVTRWVEVLTSVQRSSWETYAAVVPKVDTLGDPRFLTGQQWYIGCNTPRIQAGLPIVDPAPTVFDTGAFTTPTIACDDDLPTTISVSFNTGDAWVDEDDSALLVYAGLPQNGSRNYYAGPYRFIGTVLGDATTPPTSPQLEITPFAFIAGNLVPAYFRVTRADGRLSALQRVQTIAID